MSKSKKQEENLVPYENESTDNTNNSTESGN